MRKNGVDPCIALTIQNAVSQMMIRTFDVVALDADTEDAARLIGLLLDLRHAKNTLLLMFPIGKSDVRAAFMNRGFDMCLAENSPKECSAAVCALLRRPSADEYPTEAAPPGRIIYKDLMMDPLRQRVTMRGSQLSFTALEFKLLYFLASNPSIVFSRELIYERVWRESSLYGSKSVNDLICSIRKKMGLSPKDTDYIKTVKGVGYCFAPYCRNNTYSAANSLLSPLWERKETMMHRYSVDNGTRTHIATKFAFKAWNEMGEYE